MTLSDTHIAIVGAGIGGLAVAHALNSFGIRVTVLEQSDVLSEIGAGLSIWENGLQALDAIGLRKATEKLGRPWSEYEIHRPGRSVVVRDNRVLSSDGQVSPIIMERGSLFGVLKDNLPSSIDIVTSFKLKQIVGQKLVAEDGRTISADMIIGADGAHSNVRKHVTEKIPIFCKQVCFRGIAQLADNMPTPAEVFDERHHRFGYFPLSKNEVYWFDIVDSEDRDESFEKYRSHLEGLSPLIARIIAGTPSDAIVAHAIEEIRPVTVTHDYIALLGDAAHLMQPSLGQGACLALEDAVVLAKCLQTHSDNHPEAIRSYVSKRRRRWKSYYKMCRGLGAGALEKGLMRRQLAIAQMVHTPHWVLSTFGRKFFVFNEHDIRF